MIAPSQSRSDQAQAARRDEVYWSTTLRGQTVPNRGEGCFLLNLESNAFGDAATDILCHALYNDNWLYGSIHLFCDHANCVPAVGLNLNGNTVGPRGVLNFADILQTNTTLTVLLLQSNSNTDDRVASFINTLLRDRQKATTSMNHPMEHMLLKAVLKSWGCRRRTAEDDLLAKLLNKRKKTSAENVALKQRLLAEPKGAQPTAEAEMIQALESAIVQLTAQVHTLEKTRKASPKAKRIVATEPLTDAMLDDLSVQLKRSFGLDE
ncbi:hypothetical protein DYB32_002487 [Aphanomyces invadans]|uniref:Uncharacterized protein n=1 Tax=Aphanomyces invadans TaxID=157072 RepID=A0A418B7L3_9STRA|nr:hypothetical protein DYB32_002487 [Aphanomyces invadans]